MAELNEILGNERIKEHFITVSCRKPLPVCPRALEPV